MDERGARGERRHQRVSQLLPWYGNGTLDAAEAKGVEDHLAHCARCREELAESRELAQVIAAGAEVAPSPHPVQLARLLERIDAAESGDRGIAGRIAGRLGGRLRSLAWPRGLTALVGATPPAVRGLLAAQLAALLLLSVVMAGRYSAPPSAIPSAIPPSPAAPAAVFHTLSTADPALPEGRAEGAGGRPTAPGILRLRVVFANSAREGAILRILSEVRGQIVAGPSPLGAYTVEVPAGSDPQSLVLAHLRARPEVAFAEPVDGVAAEPREMRPPEAR